MWNHSGQLQIRKSNRKNTGNLIVNFFRCECQLLWELELNQYKKDFKSCQKLWKQNTIHISSLQLIQWTHWKTKKLIEFFPPLPTLKNNPLIHPKYIIGMNMKKNQTTICNLFYSLFIMYEYFDNKTNWNTLKIPNVSLHEI